MLKSQKHTMLVDESNKKYKEDKEELQFNRKDKEKLLSLGYK